MAKKNKSNSNSSVFMTILFVISLGFLVFELVSFVNYKMEVNNANESYNELITKSSQYRDRLSELQAKIDIQ